MDFLILLIKIALVLFVGYAAFILLYRIVFKVSLDDAEKAVNAVVKDGINAYIFNKKAILQDPVPDAILLNRLLEILKSVNLLETESTSWKFTPDFYGFPVLTFDIVASANTDFKLLQIQLEKTTQNYLFECGFNSLVHVCFKKHGENQYFVFVCYAVYKPSVTALYRFIGNKVMLNRNTAIRQAAPVVNAQLQQELAAMKKGDENV